jgi:pimeloyl-ACP methyl ester carboxylesterase
MESRPATRGLKEVAFRPEDAPLAELDAIPEGYTVLVGEDVHIHFHDWGGPPGGRGVLLLPGLAGNAWVWAPVARRLRSRRRVVAADLRGHGLSDAPFDGYEPDGFVGDMSAVIDGTRLADAPPGSVVLAGHGFGAIVAAWTAERLGPLVGGLVLVDGGWESVEQTSGVDVEEFLRGLDEPPEVMRSMAAYLGDRRDYDPVTWDADQERAAREAVVETAAGKVVRAVRPHALEASVRAMFAYDPLATLSAVAAPVTALTARDDPGGTRLAALQVAGAARLAAGRSPIRVARFEDVGHNLPRYRPAELTAAILAADGPAGGSTNG